MFIANKKLLNIIIHSKYFHPNDWLTQVSFEEALDINIICPNAVLSFNQLFYLWSKVRKPRANAALSRMFC
jgi:hypothetical protein